MILSRRQRLWFAATVGVAVLLMLIPLPPMIAALKPFWPALVLMYWALEDGARVALGLAFGLGLGLDMLNGVLLGEQALRLAVLVFIVQHFRLRLRFFPMWQQTLVIALLLFLDRLLLFLVHGFAGDPLPQWFWWLEPVVGALLWPFLFLLLDDLRTRLRLLS